MTDPTSRTPEQDAVRRLLAEARHDGPTPPEVVARLDETLASLVSGRGGSPLPDETHRETHQEIHHRAPGGTRDTRAAVVDLGARRRRRAGVGLLAAAAVVVAGVAIGQALPRTSGGDSATSAADGGADTATDSSAGAQDDGSAGGAESGDAATEMAPEARKGSSPTPLAGSPTLSSTDVGLDDDLLDLRDDAARGSASSLSGCDVRGIGRGRRVLVQVDGQAGVVVFRPVDGATQQSDVYLCGSSVPVRTLTLPAP